MNRLALLACAAITPLLAATAAHAADAADAADAPAVSELIVTGEIAFRNRTDEAAPVLSYDTDYFQRFEPLTAGDAMKRVPSVAFLSDVLESDGARLRGLDPAYTQILVNGERVPGANVDRSFFVDRIPAELIERIEIVRAPSANRSGDAVAGALNIVMRDGYSLEGGYLRAGAILLNDGRVRETVGAVWGGQVGPGRLLIGANMQGRRNPKEKFSWRYDQPGGELQNVEAQTDVRNGTDYSLNGSYVIEDEVSKFELSGLWVQTDRTQDEDSLEYNGGRITNADLAVINSNPLDILTDNWALTAKYSRQMWGGETKVRLGYAALQDRQREEEEEFEYLRDTRPFPDDDRYTRDLTITRLKDRETSFALSHERDLGGADLEFGVQYLFKDRDTNILEGRYRVSIPNPPAARPSIPGADPVLAPTPGSRNEIQETRIDPFVMLSGDYEAIKWEAGLRYETTESKINDATAPAADRVNEREYDELLPSAHIRWTLTENDRITASVARTVRRPDFNQLSPATLEAELGDNDFVGNPDLDPETAWGGDLGYERRIGARGVAGVNVFYRKVSDLIEVTNTGEEGSEGEGTFVLTVDNVGDGSVWGIEFDLSTPLDMFGWNNTGVFLNYSWLDSEIEDFIGERRFNSQSDYVLNVGFIQDVPAWGAAFGATYRKQGDAFSRLVAEEVVTSYGGDLELFVEKRFGDNLVVRLTGSNLLNGSKDEIFDKFNTVEEQVLRDYDEYEVETEEAGPVFQLVARYAF